MRSCNAWQLDPVENNIIIRESIPQFGNFPNSTTCIINLLLNARSTFRNIFINLCVNPSKSTLVIFKRFTGCSNGNRPNRSLKNILTANTPSVTTKNLKGLTLKNTSVERVGNITHNHHMLCRLTVKEFPAITFSKNRHRLDTLNSIFKSIRSIDEYWSRIKILVEIESSLNKLVDISNFYRNNNLNTVVFCGGFGIHLANLTDVRFIQVSGVHGLSAIEERNDIERIAVCKGRLATQAKRTIEIIGIVL